MQRSFTTHTQSALVFLVFLSLYVLSYKGISAGDDLYHYAAVKRWLQCCCVDLPGTLDPEQNRMHGFFVAKGQDGHLFLRLPPGLTLASVPFALVGEAIEGARGTRTGVPDVSSFASSDSEVRLRELRRQPSAFFAGLVNPVASAALVALFFGLALGVSHDRPAALLTTALLGVSTIVWPYATTYWSQPLAALCILGTVAGLWRFGETGRLASLAAAGVFSAFGVLTRTELVLVVPCALVYLVVALRRRRGPVIPALTALTVPLLCGAGLWLGWNLLRFGHPLETGSIHQSHPARWFQVGFLAESVPAQVVSLQRSLLVYSPPLLLALAAWPHLIKRRPRIGLLCGASALALFGFYSSFRMWDAHASWGPRFLVPLTPLLLLPLASWLSGARGRQRAAVGLGLVGLLVQIAVVVPGYLHADVARYWGDGVRLADLYRKTDLVPQLTALLAGRTDLWWLSGPWSLATGGLLLGVMLFAATMLLARSPSPAQGVSRAPDLR